jgi:hypothetical protein
MPLLENFKQWRNGEVFNAASYVYERDTIVNQLNRLSIILGDGGQGTDITFSGVTATSLTIGPHTITDDDTHGTLSLSLDSNVDLHLGQEMYFYAKAHQDNITVGDPVMFAGVEGNHFRIKTATTAALNANPEYFIGVAAETMASGEFGYVIEFGHLEGVNLPEADFNEGDILWFDSTNGGFTATKPPRGQAQIRVAAVIATNQNVNQTYTGELFVRPTILESTGDASVTLSTSTPQSSDGITGDVWIEYSD